MIVYFSGTGNSARVARRLSVLLGDGELLELSGERLLSPESVHISGNRIIWVFPTYSWGVPPVVADFIRRCSMSDEAVGARHYMVTTCGDDMGYADRQWRKLLEKRGIAPRSAFAVIMPNTYTLMKGFDVDSPQTASQKLAASEQRIRDIAAAIDSDGAPMLIPGRFPWIKSSVIYPWFVRHEMSPRPFRSNEGCISCGLCARRCPMENITMSDGKPVWGDRCALCLRCYHYCPRHAIAYGDKTAFKGQWQCPEK